MTVRKTKIWMTALAALLFWLPFLTLCPRAAGQTGAPMPGRIVTRYALTSGHSYQAHDPANWSLLGSNDHGKTWVTLDTQTGQLFGARDLRRVFFIDNQTAYNTYRLQVDLVSGRYTEDYELDQSVQLAEWELIGPMVGATNETDVQSIVTASRAHPLMGAAENVFDNDLTTRWVDYGLRQMGRSWIQCEYSYKSEVMVTNISQVLTLDRLTTPRQALYEKGPEILSNLTVNATESARTLTGYALTSANDEPERDPREWRLLGSSDGGKTWITLDTRRNEIFGNRFQRRTFTLAHPATFPLYRLQVDAAGPTNGLVQLGEIEPLLVTNHARPHFSVVVSAVRDNPPLESADMAFDGDPKTKWLAYEGGGTNRLPWIQWQYVPAEPSLPVINFGRLQRFSNQTPPPLADLRHAPGNVARALTGYALTSASDDPERDPRDWRLLGSNDGGKNWTTLDTRANEIFATRGERRVFKLTKQPAYGAYRLDISSVAVPARANSIQLAELEPLYDPSDSAAHAPGLQVSSRGDNQPEETVNRLFDGNAITKWLDYANDDSNRASWVQWEYAGAESPPVVNLNLRRIPQPWSPPTLKLDLKGVVVFRNAALLGLLDQTGFQIFEAGPQAEQASVGEGMRLTGTLKFGGGVPRVENGDVEGLGPTPFVTNILAAGVLSERQPFARCSLEGTVTSVLQEEYYTTLRLTTLDGSRVAARIVNPGRNVVPDYSGCQVRLEGVAESAFSETGERVTGAVWISGVEQIAMALPTESEWSQSAQYPLNSPAAAKLPVGRLARLRGKVVDQSGGRMLTIGDGTNQMVVYLDQTNLPPLNTFVEALGFLARERGATVLRPAYVETLGERRALATPFKSTTDFDEHTVLTRVSQVNELIQSQEPGTFPVRLRGVITYLDLNLNDFYLQQGSESIQLGDQLSAGLCPYLGQEGRYVEFRGVEQNGFLFPTDFVHFLGPARPPEPLRHSLNYMMTGKDDGKWVEMEGVVSACEEHRLTLAVTGGQLIVWINQLDRDARDRLLGSRVRIAGVCSMVLNGRNQRLGVRLLVPSGENIEMVTPAPDNPFDLPAMPISEVMRSDAANNVAGIQLLKTSGVVTYKSATMLFIQSGVDGVRVIPRAPADVHPGDRVEVVGLAEPDGFSPKITQALVRKVGRAGLPPASPINLLEISSGTEQATEDATRGQVDAYFLGQSLGETLDTLELRDTSTKRNFYAYLPLSGDELPVIPVGSLVRLRGVFKARTDNVQDIGEAITSFEMYLNSPRDIVIRERPSWWTARHTWWTLAGAAGLVLMAGAWGLALNQQVRQRTRELKIEIGERKAAENALREKEEFIHNVIDTDPNMIFVKDLEGRFTLVNRARAEFNGQKVDDIVGKLESELNPRTEEVAAFQRDDRQVMETQREKFTREEKLTSRLGQTVWLQTVKRPLIGPDGTARHVLGVSTDITDRKRAEAFLNTVLQNLPMGVFIKDARQLRFIMWNRCNEELWGFQNDEMVGKSDYEIAPVETADRFVARDRETLTSRRLIEVEEEIETRYKGRRVLHTRKIPIMDEAGEPLYLLGISEDITDRKMAEAELKRTHEQLLDASRMAGMAEVATSVLHNVGNVLNSVNISSCMVTDRVRDSKVVNLSKAAELMNTHAADLGRFMTEDPRGRQLPGYLTTLSAHLAREREEILGELVSLNGNIAHIMEIVTMQQSYARISGVMESLSVVDLVEDALRMNAGAISRHDIELVRDYRDRPVALVDKHKVLQILVNLIRNAKYALDDGNPPEKRLTLRVSLDGNGRVSIAITDNGIGIPPENLVRIFEHGFTTRKSGHGFGLHSGALAARELGGTLRVESAGPGRGATFILELPSQAEPRTI